MATNALPLRTTKEDAEAGVAAPPQPSGLRKKSIMSEQLEKVLDDIAPGQGKEIIGGAIARIERRLQVLEKSLTNLVEQQELSVRDRIRAIAAAEESISAIIARFDNAEQSEGRQFATVRSNLAYLEERVSELENATSASQPANGELGAPNEQPAPVLEQFESIRVESPLAPPATEPAAPSASEADKRDDYLTSARRAALAVARDEAPLKDAARRKSNRTKLLTFAVLAPIALLGTALMAINRNTVTASPIAAAGPADIVQTAALPPVPAERSTASELPAAAPAVSLAVLKEAADKGDVAAMRDAGLKYLSGVGGEAASDTEAARWLMRAAYKGDAEAEYWLATLYAGGRGVPKDALQAMHWYETAAKQGHARAMHNLAVAHYEGWHEKNIAEATKWFQAASENGNKDSAFNLAVLYEQGSGVPQDIAQAVKWYSVAAAAGDEEAAKRVEVLIPALKPEDLDAARSAIAAIKPKG